MKILMISDQKMLMQAYKLYSRSIMWQSVNFITTSNVSIEVHQEINAVLIDTYNKPKVFIKRCIRQYIGRPIFLMGSDDKKNRLLKIENIAGIFAGDISIRDVIKSIKMTLDLDVPDYVSQKDQIQMGVKERAVLECLALGYSNKEIARDFGLNISTVKYYIRRLYIKLNVRNRVQAALIAREIIV